MKSFESLIKSLFISVFPFSGLIVFVYGIIQFVQNDGSSGVLGMIFISATIVIFFIGLFIQPRARTDKNLKLFSIGVVAGVLTSIVGLLSSGVDLYSNSLSLILLLGWVLYLKWFSKFDNRTNEILKSGNQLVEFELENTKRKKISSSTFLGSPSIFLFYRGNWCPLCMAQIKEIVDKYKELEKLGVQTVLISPQPHKYTKNLAEKFQINFHFMVDFKNQAAKRLGIFAENGIPAGFQILGYDSNTVMPTVVITNKDGKIIFTDLTDNYRLRPEPEVFLKIIRESIV